MDLDLGENLNTEIEKIEDQGVKRKILSHLAHRITRPGSLGQLEEIALQIGLVQQRTIPVISQPCLYVFAGDHGITSEKVSANFKKRTSELVLEFLNEGAAINLFARQNGLSVRVVDVGIDHSFESTLSYWLHQGTSFFNRKIGRGTKNFLEFPAMTTNEMSKAMRVGIKLMEREYKNDCNMVGIGDLGIGNTSSASALCAAIQDCDPEKYLLRSGFKEESYQHKLQVLRKALGKHPKTHDPLTLLTLFGGFEIAAMVGAMLRAAHLRMLILIDGFVSATALLIACQLSPAVTDYCVFCSASDEPGHQQLLRDLNARPLLDLNLKLGEGIGISLAFPLVRNAVSILQQEQF